MFALYCIQEQRLVAVGSSRYQAADGYTVHEVDDATADQIRAEMGSRKLSLADGRVVRGAALRPQDIRVKGDGGEVALEARRASLLAQVAEIDAAIEALKNAR